MATLLRKPQISKINARHLLDDLASSYSYSLEEAVLVELIANSLDAKAANIRVDVDQSEESVTVLDDGEGMDEEEFEKYHDLAESHKVRGRGIGFAGLGAKLGHKMSSKVITETRSGKHGLVSEWRFKGSDLQWLAKRSRTPKKDGTKVKLLLGKRRRRLLSDRFIEETIRLHYGALLEPYLSDLYIWEPIYPAGVTFHVNGRQLTAKPSLAPDLVLRRKEVELQSRRKRRIARAVFILAKEPLPEEQQGVALATYGKTIRRDTLGVHPQHPELLTGWVEAPELVECLTLNKQDFQTAGSQGKKFSRVRRELQKAFSEWLKEIGETREPEATRRAPRRLELETATILRRIPELRFLFGAPVRDTVNTPDPHGDAQAVLDSMSQQTLGEGPSGLSGEGISASPGPDEGEAPREDEGGPERVRRRPRTTRGGPRIARVADPQRADVSWVDADTVAINTAHPVYLLAGRRNLLSYHERLAVYLALCKEAPVEPDERLGLLSRTLTEWGRMNA